jgi:hypothetical protein
MNMNRLDKHLISVAMVPITVYGRRPAKYSQDGDCAAGLNSIRFGCSLPR